MDTYLTCLEQDKNNQDTGVGSFGARANAAAAKNANETNKSAGEAKKA